MKLTPRILKAINLAAELHENQKRKGDGLPYIVHLFAVTYILLEYTKDEEVILAGILHDTIEDTYYKKEQMEKDFGARVTEMVLDLTDPPKSVSWLERKQTYLKHLANSDYETKLICAADKLHNLISISEAFRRFGEKAYEKFNAPLDKKLWFYEECYKILESDSKMPKRLMEDIEDVLRTLKNQ